MESVGSRMTRLGRSLLTLNRLISPEEVVEKISAVKQEDVQKLAQELLNRQNLLLLLLDPLRIYLIKITFCWSEIKLDKLDIIFKLQEELDKKIAQEHQVNFDFDTWVQKEILAIMSELAEVLKKLILNGGKISGDR